MPKPLITLIILNTIFVTCGSALAAKTEEEKRVAALESEGRLLTKSVADNLEKKLIESPSDLDTRIKLVVYHWFRQYNSDRTIELQLWIIEHHPESPITEEAAFIIDRKGDRPVYDKAAELWRLHVEENGTNTVILSHAAHFFQTFEYEKAASYLERCRRLEPNSAEWPKRLGFLYSLNRSDKALPAWESALSKTKGRDRYRMLGDVADAAWVAEDLDKAERYATELLAEAVERPPDLFYGQAVHYANLLLGLVALQRDDVERAERYLLRAGKTPGSVLIVIKGGPSMRLALALLQKGRKEAVIEYLKLCGKFWNKPQAAAWIRDIEQGVTPNFGKNLDY